MSNVVFVQHCPQFGGSPISGLVSVRALMDAGMKVNAVFGSEGPFVERYREAGCEVDVIPHKSWLNPAGLFRFVRNWPLHRRAAKSFADFFRQVKPDLVFNNTLVPYPAAAAARQVGAPCLWHIRELFTDVGGEMAPPPLLGKSFVRRTIRNLARRIAVNSKAVAQNILGPALAEKATVIPNSVPDRMFDPAPPGEEARAKLDLPAGVPIVGVPGTLRPMKGHPFFVKAIPSIAEKIADSHFAITGEINTGFAREVEASVKALGLGDRCRFLGRVEAMDAFYGASDVICIPSRAEPFGRVVIEAFAMGKPVVASAVGGIREIIDDGENGRLVEYGDAGKLADEMVAALNDVNRREAWGKAAREKATREYTESTYRKRICELVESAIGR